MVVLFILAGFLLPAMSHRGRKSYRISCYSNLKQIGLAFRMWSNDHGDKFPWEVSSENGSDGTKEFLKTDDVWRHFQAVSNELNTPKVLRCFDDKERTRVLDFAALNNSHLSYFIGIDSNTSNSQSILAGDRNVVVSNKLVKGQISVERDVSLEWTSSIHNKNGNFVLADGSGSLATAQILNKQLQSAFLSTTQSVFRFAFPQ